MAYFYATSGMKQLMARIEKARPIALVLHLVPITRKSCGHCASIFPVFIPRRLYMVNALPRNSTGKLPYQSLESMVQSLRAAQYKT